MYLEDLVIRTKLMPLRHVKRTLHRPRLTQIVKNAVDYRLTILQAGAGYGKSTTLTALTKTEHSLVWYHLDAEDTDPLTFLLYLLHGFTSTFESLSEEPLALLEAYEGPNRSPPWAAVIDTLINEIANNISQTILLVLDDAHLLNQIPGGVDIVSRLLKHAPSNLHIILSTRYPLKLDDLVKMRVSGRVLEIDEADLAFTPDEIRQLFHKEFDVQLTVKQAEIIRQETEGWAIALQLIGQGLQQKTFNSVPVALEKLSGLKEDLFDYLAHEVLEQQPKKIQQFLTETSVLRQMNPALCDCVREIGGSDQILEQLLENGLFVIELDGSNSRYHYLFREFLYHQLSEERRRQAHLKAADCYQHIGEPEEAIHHLIKAEAYVQAVALINEIGRRLVSAGRLETLASWIDSMPPETLATEPLLTIYLGDIARLHSRFEEALRWYKQAEDRFRTQGKVQGVARALRGQARVYLDTVNPSAAEAPLAEALRLSDGQEDREIQANLLDLLAENQLNRGRTEEAQRLRAEARALREEAPNEAMLDVRVKLRTGRLEDARRVLAERIATEREQPVLRPRAHRETLLLLAFIQVYQGEAEAGYTNAVEGTKRGMELDSPFVTAVGYMRQGHAWLIRDDDDKYEQAVRCFNKTIEISEKLSVSRLKVEAFWGLCRAYGYRGMLSRAEVVAGEGLAIAQQAGDEWIAALIRVSMGAGYTLAERYEEALRWLGQAEAGFRECSDTYGEAITRLWQCIIWLEQDDEARLKQGLDDLLDLVRAHSYEYLVTRRTLAGPPDVLSIVPVLLYARSHDIDAPYAASLLEQMGLADIEYHPGYQLRIQTLGTFRVWRGEQEVNSSEWQREKARQLFQLLITYRGSLLDREKIWGILWPEMAEDAANQSFKVALNAMYNAIEPARKRGAPCAYVIRKGSRYGLRSEADLWLDASAFEQAVSKGDDLFHDEPIASIEPYQGAVVLYQGDYLEEFIYEEWTHEERVRLREMFLRTADRVAKTLIDEQRWEEAIAISQRILTVDDCWERAYRFIMTAYAQLGNRPQALRIYQRAEKRLREELDAPPSPETIELHQSILDSTYP